MRDRAVHSFDHRHLTGEAIKSLLERFGTSAPHHHGAPPDPVLPRGDGAAASGLDRPVLPGPLALSIPRIRALLALTVAFAVITIAGWINRDLDRDLRFSGHFRGARQLRRHLSRACGLRAGGCFRIEIGARPVVPLLAQHFAYREPAPVFLQPLAGSHPDVALILDALAHGPQAAASRTNEPTHSSQHVGKGLDRAR